MSAHVLLNLLKELRKKGLSILLHGVPRSILFFSGRYHIISNASLITVLLYNI